MVGGQSRWAACLQDNKLDYCVVCTVRVRPCACACLYCMRVSAHVCVCVYVCWRVHECVVYTVSVHACVRVRSGLMCACPDVRYTRALCPWVCACVRVNMSMCRRACVWECTFVSACTCVSVCVRVHMLVSACSYILDVHASACCRHFLEHASTYVHTYCRRACPKKSFLLLGYHQLAPER